MEKRGVNAGKEQKEIPKQCSQVMAATWVLAEVGQRTRGYYEMLGHHVESQCLHSPCQSGRWG